jgi:hypothetical protein
MSHPRRFGDLQVSSPLSPARSTANSNGLRRAKPQIAPAPISGNTREITAVIPQNATAQRVQVAVWLDPGQKTILRIGKLGLFTAP